MSSGLTPKAPKLMSLSGGVSYNGLVLQVTTSVLSPFAPRSRRECCIQQVLSTADKEEELPADAALGAALPQASPRLRLLKTRPPVCTAAGREGQRSEPQWPPSTWPLTSAPEPWVWRLCACSCATSRSGRSHSPGSDLTTGPFLFSHPGQMLRGPRLQAPPPRPRSEDSLLDSVASRLTPAVGSPRSLGPQCPPTATANGKDSPFLLTRKTLPLGEFSQGR